MAPQVRLHVAEGKTRSTSAGLSARVRAMLVRSTYARHRIRHRIRHTEVLAGRRPRPPVANDRLRHTRIGYARVSEADGSQSRDRPRGVFRSLPSPSRTGALRRLRFASARRVTAAAGRVCARVFSELRAHSTGERAAQFGQIICGHRANYLRFSIRFGARKLRGNEGGSDVARSTFRTDTRRSVLFDTSTTPETAVSWGTAAIGRRRR